VADPESVAQAYHDLTKYTEENVRTGPGLDWSRRPLQFKEIVSQQRVSLRPHMPVRMTDDGPEIEMPATPSGCDLAKLSRLLFFTNGVTGLIRYESGGQVLRAAPSAGALYPTEVYVAARDVEGLEPGLYNYQVPTHELVRLWEEDPLAAIASACGDDPLLARTPFVVLLTGVFWRSAWRYRERGYRRVLLDTGHVLANLCSYAAAEGLGTRTFLGFNDADLNGLFFFDDAVEAALLCVGFSTGGDAATAPLWPSGTTAPGDLEGAILADETALRESATVRLHRASACEGGLPATEPAQAPAVTDRSVPLAATRDLAAQIPRAILRRRSARGYSGGPLALDALGEALGFAFGRALATRDVLRAFVVAGDVEDLEAGVYLVEGAGEALLPLALGDVRERMHRISLGQELAKRCAATLVLAAPAEAAVARWGDRAYRYLHLEAGAVGQRFQLAAGALDCAACGIGGFFDDETAALVGADAGDWILYLITIGKS